MTNHLDRNLRPINMNDGRRVVTFSMNAIYAIHHLISERDLIDVTEERGDHNRLAYLGTAAELSLLADAIRAKRDTESGAARRTLTCALNRLNS